MARWDKEATSTIPDWFWEAVDTRAYLRAPTNHRLVFVFHVTWGCRIEFLAPEGSIYDH